MKQTKKSIADMKLDYEEKFVICILAMIIGYTEGKYGSGRKKTKRLTDDDIFNNSYYMFQRLKSNAKKPPSVKKAKP